MTRTGDHDQLPMAIIRVEKKADCGLEHAGRDRDGERVFEDEGEEQVFCPEDC